MRMTFEEWFFSNKEKIIDLYNRETDPNYECKVAYAQGKVIQYRTKDSSDAWKDCPEEPYWTEVCEYRVKPGQEKRRWTNRELAKWIAQGNGQAKDINSSTITSRGLMYDEGDDDKPCPDWLVIRGWDETEWSDPLVEE